MYTPAAFEEKRLEVLHGYMRRYSFALLVTGGGGLLGSHLPFLLDGARGAFGTLRSHLAVANGQMEAVRAGEEALVIFSGPHAYISPRWYATKLSVPTWNYVAVHAYGRMKVIVEGEGFRKLLEETVATYEAGAAAPWGMGVLPEEMVGKLQGQIVGFEMEITRLEGKVKMNQNRTAADRAGVIAGLKGVGGEMEREVARVMEEGAG